MKALSGVRVLDLTNEVGAYTSKLFADLGAEVIRVEPPGGSTLRKRGPFYQDNENLDASFQDWYFNTNKKGIVVDIRQEDGQKIIKSMLKETDILIESFSPGYLTKYGLDYETLSLVNPAMVYTSITPFGQYGPYKDYKATDIIGLSMGGLMYLGGEPERSPVRAYGNQAYFAAATYAAVGTIIAFYHAEGTGEGQHIDVSMQESVAMAMENAAQYYDLQGTIRKRVGGGQVEAAWGTFPCKDGFIYLLIGGFGDRYWDHLHDWMKEEGNDQADEFLNPRWKDVNWRSTDEGKQLFYDIFVTFSMKFTKLAFYEEAQRRIIPASPVNNPKDLFENPQIEYREFFTTIEHGETNEIIYPGSPYVFSKTPWELQHQAPKLGEHSEEILSRYKSIQRE